jgi:hypothetical protein
MGHGSWSNVSYSTLSNTKGYKHKSREEIFQEQTLSSKLDPKQMKDGVRESRDSEDHPETLPIIIALDVTGSMGRIPEAMVKEDLPKLMSRIIKEVHQHPHIMFLGIGDGNYDSYPIQVSQFEADTELIDESLTEIVLEGGGGGNKSESYTYAWLIGGRHTVTDQWDKRGGKGFIFTIGDEQLNPRLSVNTLQNHMGYESPEEIQTTKELFDEVSEKYHVFHIHVTDGSYGTESVKKSWDILGQNFIACESSMAVNKIVEAMKGVLEDRYIKGSDPVNEEKQRNKHL